MSEQENKKGRAARRISWLDIAVILLAILCVVAVWQRANLQFFFEGEHEQTSFSVVLLARAVPETAAEMLAKDTRVYQGGAEVGVVTDGPSLLPCTVLLPGENGDAAVEVTNPNGLVDLSVTLTCQGVLRDGGLVLSSGAVLLVGETADYQTEQGALSFTVMLITKNG